jgi:maltooligosyltrehalose trehalohydrolase
MKPPFLVWAPRARRVELERVPSGERVELTPEPGGHFRLETPPDGAYQLRLDGGPAVPDPRADDVESVHGPCHRLDHSAFPWTDGGHRWRGLEGAVLYELHLGTFSPEGNFDGALKKLPLLRDLGITHVEVMPVATFNGARGWGYDGTALFAPHRAYGGPEAMKRFVDGAHRLELGVLLDVVYNHLGPSGNYLGQFGPYFDEGRHTPWGAAVNFDGPGSAPVRQFFIDNALHWLEHYHLDGLRLDAVHAIHDESALHFLEQLVGEVTARLPRPALLIAESDLNDPRLVRQRRDHGFGLDAQWCDDLHHALHAALTGEGQGYYADFADPLPCLARALDEGYVYQGQPSVFRQKLHGRPLGSVPLQRLVGFAQNHDQIGNRAQGERLHQLCGIPRARAALTLLLLGPHTPLLFQGEEWSATAPFQFFTDHQDPQIARATTEGRRRDVGDAVAPDPQAPQTFAVSRLDWDERKRLPHLQTLELTRMLLKLRAGSELLQSSTPGRTTVDAERRILTYERGPFFYALNLAARPYDVALPRGTWVPALPLLDGARLAGAGAAVSLDPDSFALFSRA